MGKFAPGPASVAGVRTAGCADLSEISSQPEALTRVYAPPAASFTVTVEGAGATSCFVGERVLVALERGQGLGKLRGLPRKLPVGCRRGGCGVCRARVLKGEYRREPMSRAHISERDEVEGLILACSIYPLSDLLLRLEAANVVKDKRSNDQHPEEEQSWL